MIGSNQSDEFYRVSALEDYQILDTQPEKEFDSITRLASYICKVPFAGITFIDDDRLRFKSTLGITAAEIDKVEPFCLHTLQSASLLEVTDTFGDSRFIDDPLIDTDDPIRFYAGAPLIDPTGNKFGLICVFDTKPHFLDDDQKDALLLLATTVIDLLETKKRTREWQEFRDLFNSSGEIHCILNQKGEIEYINNSIEAILGYKPEEMVGKTIWHFSLEGERERIFPNPELEALAKETQSLVETRALNKDGEIRWISWSHVIKKGRWLINGRDVTEEKKVLADFEQLSLVASSIDNGVALNDSEGKVIWVNESFTRITGYKSVEVVGKRIGDVIRGDKTDEKLIIKARNHTNNKEPFSIDLLVYTRQGEPLWLSIMSSVILDGKGEVIREIEIFTDITERKHAELELETFSMAVEKSTGGVLIRNERNEVVWMNKSLEQIFGYKIEELQGYTLGEILEGEKTDLATLNYMRSCTAEVKPYQVEIIFYRKDRTPVCVCITNDPIVVEGKFYRQVALVVDVTERRKAEEDNRLLSLVASKTGSGVIITDRDDKVSWVNESWERMFDYSLQEVRGKIISEVIKGDDINLSELRRIDSLKDAGKPFEVELLKYKRDGSPVWISVFSTPVFNGKGEKEQEIKIINDISERKAAEQELIKAREEALQLSKAKETFLSVMSHEIRTPLNAVIGLTHLLLEDNPSPSQLDNLNILKFSGENLLALVNNVLDFSKIETGNLKLEVRDINLKDLVSKTINSLQFKAREKKISLVSEFDDQIPDYVKGDSVRIYQILINLLGNSIKFTETGEVKLTVALDHITASRAVVRFEVSDTGIGIAEDKLRSIFEAYSQAENSIARKYGGTGLGLTITRQLIKLYDSEIFVESEPGKGSRFFFTISFATSESVIESTTKPAEKRFSDVSVLVVEDNKINSTLAKKVFSRWGILPDFAENGLEAVSKIQKNDYDLVLMDLHMPEMDGFEATKTVRGFEEERFKLLPIIALTASFPGSSSEKILTSGMNGYVNKPYTPAELYSEIETYLEEAQKRKS